MIVKILSKSSTFGAVQYNTQKINRGDGELMCFENFPFSKDILPKPNEIKDYLKAVSNTNKRIKNAQFHATISAKGREYSKEQLTEIGREFLSKMGYSKQPFIIVAHKDTENNHIHLVSTRVTIEGKKIDHNFENIRAQKCLQEILKKSYGIDEKERLANLLNYKISSPNQFRTLLEVSHLQLSEKDGKYKVYKAGIFISDVDLSLDKKRDLIRTKQLQEIFKSYFQTYNHTLKKNERGVFSSEMTDKLKSSLGIDVVFHVSDKTNKPFGYTVIDNSEKAVYKGSEIFELKHFMNEEQNSVINKDQIRTNETNVENENINSSLDQQLDEDLNNIKSNDILKSVLDIINSGGGGQNQNENEQENKNKKRRKR